VLSTMRWKGNVTAVGFQKDNRWMYTGAGGGGGRRALVLNSKEQRVGGVQALAFHCEGH
jgi:hypothetical protein